jgi:DnaK suppressor protein
MDRICPPEGFFMQKETIFKFKMLFEEQRRNLLYSNSLINENFNVQKEELIDEMDMTSTEVETSMRIRLRNREALFLKKIQDALSRIKEGTFGLCEDCGGDIDIRRLEVRPTATLCVHCKEEQERNEQIHIDGHRSKSLGTKLRIG